MKKIAIYGAGLEGEKFYYQYKDEYHIMFAIDKTSDRFFHELYVYNLSEVPQNNSIDMIVVTSSKYYYEIREVLIARGYEENKDFCSAYHFITKYKCIVYGNCHASAVGTYLTRNSIFKQKYDTKIYFVHENATSKELYPDDEELYACDLLIAQDIQDNNSVGAYSFDTLQEKSRKECKIVKVPNTFGMNLYFPQIAEHRSTEYKPIESIHFGSNLIIDDCASNRYLVNGIIGFRDYNIEEMLSDGLNSEEIAYRIENVLFFSEEELRQNVEIELDKLRKREETCSITISDYIEENYQKKKLFYDIFHPTSDIYIEKAKRILKLLNIPVLNNIHDATEHDQTETFVYGCVRSALRLEWYDEYIKQNHIDFTLDGVSANRVAYINSYRKWFTDIT